MAVYVSNLVVGLDTGLNDPELLEELGTYKEGAAGIELFVHTYSKDYMEKLKVLAPRFKEKGIALALHGPFVGIEAGSPKGTREYEILMSGYEQAFALAKELGCTHVVFHTQEDFLREEEKARRQRNCLDNLEKLIKTAGQYGVRLHVENLALPSKGTPVFDQEEYLGLFDRFADIDALIDMGHLYLAGWDMERVISGLKSRITAYHLHNNDGRTDGHCRIGCGNLSYEQFFELYHRYTPGADLTLEYRDDYGITKEELIEDLRWVHYKSNHMKKGGI